MVKAVALAPLTQNVSKKISTRTDTLKR